MVAGRELEVMAGGEGGEKTVSMVMAGLDSSTGTDEDSGPEPESTTGRHPGSGPEEQPCWTFGGGGTNRQGGDFSRNGPD